MTNSQFILYSSKHNIYLNTMLIVYTKTTAEVKAKTAGSMCAKQLSIRV